MSAENVVSGFVQKFDRHRAVATVRTLRGIREVHSACFLAGAFPRFPRKAEMVRLHLDADGQVTAMRPLSREEAKALWDGLAEFLADEDAADLEALTDEELLAEAAASGVNVPQWAEQIRAQVVAAIEKRDREK